MKKSKYVSVEAGVKRITGQRHINVYCAIVECERRSLYQGSNIDDAMKWAIHHVQRRQHRVVLIMKETMVLEVDS